MHRLSVCTKPRYQSYIAIDDIQLLATSLESMYELIVDGTDLSQVMKLPKEVQSLVLSYLAPFSGSCCPRSNKGPTAAFVEGALRLNHVFIRQ